MKDLIRYFNDKFGEIFHYLLYSTQNVKDILVHRLTEKERKEAWKGILVGQLLKSFRVKNYICEKLQEMGLTRNTTLEEFYTLSSKRIHLNFAAI